MLTLTFATKEYMYVVTTNFLLRILFYGVNTTFFWLYNKYIFKSSKLRMGFNCLKATEPLQGESLLSLIHL